MESVWRFWSVVAGLALGVVVAVFVSLLGSSARRAEASVLVSSSAGTQAVRPMLPNLRELAMGGVVAGNVRSTLRLTESTEKVRSRLHVNVRPQSEVIAISATDSSADHARQLAQEAAVVFAQLVGARFGAGKPELHAAVLDSAHVQGGPERHFLRNGLIGGLVGLLLGSASMFVLASGRRGVVAAGGSDGDVGERERLLDQRVQGVTARERALAARAGELAKREQELEARATRLTADEHDRATQIAASQAELEALASAPAPPPRAPEPVAEPEPALPTRAGAWNLNDLQRAVDAQTSATPEQAEEWRTYLYFIREHAAPDGSLPRSMDALIEDVFRDVRHPTGPS